jgi:hypothetical protein
MPNYGLAMPGPAPSLRHRPSARIYEDDTFAGKSGAGYQNLRVRFEDEFGEDDTENVEYTTEIRANLRNAAPRRRKTTQNRQVEIREDVGMASLITSKSMPYSVMFNRARNHSAHSGTTNSAIISQNHTWWKSASAILALSARTSYLGDP